MSDIEQWLEQLGLGKYAQVFASSDIGFDVLPELTDDVLKELGVSVGDRLRLLKAAREYNASEATTTLISSSPTTPIAEAERRQLTVMFCDLVGSTALSESMDPERFREVIAIYQSAVSTAIQQFDGYIARYMGDGLLVYFGYPQAHEDDAERAVRAGLGIVEAVGKIDEQDGTMLQVRIGIATGLVVAGDIIGEGASEERSVLGDTPNLAARLQGIAPPNGVIIMENTLRLTEGLFVVNSLGDRSLKGLTSPVATYQVTGVSKAPSRFEAAAMRGLVPLVGRESEVGLLLDRWNQAKEGEGQVVLLSGEAGVGKSRIVRGFQERVENDQKSRVLYYCSPHHQSSALHPVINQLWRGLRFETEDKPEMKLDKLEAVLEELGLPVSEHALAIASLVSVPTAGRYQTIDLTPQELRQRTFDTLLAVFKSMAVKSPLLVIVEDAHWTDPSTAEFVGLLISWIRNLPILVVINHRSEFDPPWGAHAHMTSILLNRMARRECVVLVEKVTQGKTLPAEVVDEIVLKTDGIPLFVEELTKTILNSELLEDKGAYLELTGPLPKLGVPASLHDALMARLDQLAQVKEVAQLAATIGRSFDYELLLAVSLTKKKELDEALSRLIDAGLIYQLGLGATIAYEFKHALIQETAYQSLLKSTRQRIHLRIAEVLAAQFPESNENQPELLAHHNLLADRPEQAVAYWQRAAERAVQRSANLEAINHIESSLDVIRRLPDNDERTTLELSLLLILGPALMATKGWSAEEVETTYTRAHQLCQYTGAPSQQFAATWGLWMNHQSRANHRIGRELASELQRLSERINDGDLLLQAHHANWTTRLYTGELDSAQDLSIYDPDKHGHHALTYASHDPGVCGYAQNAMLLWLKGFPDQARESGEHALAITRKISHAPSTVHALYFTARLSTMRREPEVTLAFVDAMDETARELALTYYLAIGSFFRGWALVELGKQNSGISELNQGFSSLRASRSASAGPHNCCLMASAWGKQGQVAEALKVVDETLDTVARTGEAYWEAELYRLKGALLLSMDDSNAPQSESVFRKAMDTAEQQGAKSLELRAAIALARLWQDQGKQEAAGRLLRPIYDWFCEGFDTADLIEASVLLDEL